jgi:serralysin
LELFQLIDPPHERRPDEMEYWKSNVFHLHHRSRHRRYGGAAADRFDFNAAAETPDGSGRDIIQGFSRAEGDRIDLATIDADTSANPGNDKFSFIGAEAFHGGGGELRFAGGILRGDINGDRVADFEIKVIGSTLGAADLIL